jgi:hypothetical protein
MWNDVKIGGRTYINILFHDFTGETVENHEIPQDS